MTEPERSGLAGRSGRPLWAGLGWLAAAASLVAAVGLAMMTGRLRQEVSRLEARLEQANAVASQARGKMEEATRLVRESQARVAVLQAPDVTRVDLAGQPPAPNAVGRAFWSRSRGLVLAAAGMPPLPQDKTYQLWVVTKKGPVVAGLLAPDQAGRVSAIFPAPPVVDTPVAMAITLEPKGGAPAPTGEKYLVGAVEFAFAR